MKEKNYLIQKAKRNTFRTQLQNMADTQQYWRIAKWGKEKAGKPPELPIVPELTKPDGGTARTLLWSVLYHPIKCV